MQLPKGFTAIKDATSTGELVNLIGVLVSCNGPRPSRGADHVLDFTIQDDFTSGCVGDQSSISGRMFKPQGKFPKISGPGDIVILRKFKLGEWMGRMDCVGSKLESAMTVFPSSRIPVPELSHAFQAGSQKLPCDSTMMAPQPTIPEQMAVIHLKHASSSSTQQVRQHAVTAASKLSISKRESLIKDLQLNSFHDVLALVLSVYYYPMGGQVELKITDYTPNDAMWYYADPEKEPSYMVRDGKMKGPYGYLILNVTLYEQNAAWARDNVAVGDFVFLRNMRVKMSKENKLEGALHQDQRNAEQVDIRHLKNVDEIAKIKARRDEYEKSRGGNSAFEVIQNEPRKPSAKVSHNKKAAKRERQRAAKEAEQQELEEQAREWDMARSGVNTNIRGAYTDYKSSTISEINNNPHLHMRTPEKYNDYTLPFVNCRYRSCVRVVDVFPPQLELFAHSSNDPTWAQRPKKLHKSGEPRKEYWEWGFVLLVEDAEVPRGTESEKLRVVVDNGSAQYLLKMDAQDLKKNPRALKQLERKLFILWGNLMELKTELREKGSDLPLPRGDNRLQNKPFDACIEEYGCEVPLTDENGFGYQRMHKLSLTTISD